jgi:ribosome maturation factor RimP
MDVRSEVVDMATPLADELGFELVDVDFVPQAGRSLVRVFLDRPGGITLDDCARFSRRLGDLLEMNQTLSGAYNLEVSSPGIERRLRTEEHFRRFLGQEARVELFDVADGRRRGEGRIEAAGGESVQLRLTDGGAWKVPLAAIKSARLKVDPWAGRRSKERERRDGGRGRHRPGGNSPEESE